MAMAEHAALVARIYLDGFCLGCEPKVWPGKEIPHNRLKVAVGKPRPGFKGIEPPRKTSGPMI